MRNLANLLNPLTRVLRKGISIGKFSKRVCWLTIARISTSCVPFYTEFIELQTSTKHKSKPKTIDQPRRKMSVVHVAYHIFNFTNIFQTSQQRNKVTCGIIL